ncbi:MAG: rRNA guanine-N(1)-methyltransferase [Acidimicrobiaceae bacterium]|nr:rRNA guanine-N(1)-methyltransferase [Acidimicrobiaceae bacterium]
MLKRIGELPPKPTVLEVGCSSGYLLEDLRSRLPNALLVGLDFIFSGLRKAASNARDARVGQADACHLPITDSSVDAVVSANVLEHVPDDAAALIEIGRVLRPGARGVLVVPAAPGTYDYYDRFLHHQRRYARGELGARARSAGLEVLEEIYLGTLIYPAFWAVKKYHRARFDKLEGAELEAKVAVDIASTTNSPIGTYTCRIEEEMIARRVRLPVGIRTLVVVRRPKRAER